MYELHVRFEDGDGMRQVFCDYGEAQDARDMWYDCGAVHVWITRIGGGNLPDTRYVALMPSMPGDESLRLV